MQKNIKTVFCMLFPLLILTSCQSIAGAYINERDENNTHIIHAIKLRLDNSCDYIIDTYEDDVLISTYSSPVCSWKRRIANEDYEYDRIILTITNENYNPEIEDSNNTPTITKSYNYIDGKMIDRSTRYEYVKESKK